MERSRQSTEQGGEQQRTVEEVAGAAGAVAMTRAQMEDMMWGRIANGMIADALERQERRE